MKKIFNKFAIAALTLAPAATFALEPYQSETVTIKDPVEGLTMETVIGLVISWILVLVGGIAVLFLIWGGLQYVTSSGNKDKAEQAKKTITYAVIGLIVIVLAGVIVDMVLGFPFTLGVSTN